jgi:hypothetical protein
LTIVLVYTATTSTARAISHLEEDHPMDIRAKQELAQAYCETVRIHEASFDRARMTYAMSWHEAAERGCVDSDLVDLVYAMAAGGYCDYADWAERFIPKLKAVQA